MTVRITGADTECVELLTVTAFVIVAGAAEAAAVGWFGFATRGVRVRPLVLALDPVPGADELP